MLDISKSRQQSIYVPDHERDENSANEYVPATRISATSLLTAVTNATVVVPERDPVESPQPEPTATQRFERTNNASSLTLVVSTPTLAAATEQSVSPEIPNIQPPDAFVVNYWRMVNEGEYEDAWQALSPGFQEHNHDSQYSRYLASRRDFCSTRAEDPRILSIRSTEATVFSQLVYQSGDNCERMTLDLVYDLILSPDGKIWLIDVVRQESEPISTPTTAFKDSASALSSQGEQWSLFFSDAFMTDTGVWYTGTYRTPRLEGTITVGNGNHLWQVTTFQETSWWLRPDLAAISNFSLDVEMQQVSGPTESSYGVIFRLQENGNFRYYRFRITGSQTYEVAFVDGNTVTTLIDWTWSSAIRPSDSNQIRIIGQGSQFTFYINGEYVDETSDRSLDTGQVGIIVGLPEADQAVFQTTNFTVRTP